jgi:hypothetical protein
MGTRGRDVPDADVFQSADPDPGVVPLTASRIPHLADRAHPAAAEVLLPHVTRRGAR